MGRYYSGDINGKFWFAVQSSDAASRFGGIESEPQHIDYYFDEDSLKEVEEEIKNIKKSLGKYKESFDEFFTLNNGYNDEELITFFKEKGMNARNIPQHLKDYADLGLGIKIRDCIKESGYCEFEAEL